MTDTAGALSCSRLSTCTTSRGATFLGRLCRHGHDEGGGQSLRYARGNRNCVQCERQRNNSPAAAEKQKAAKTDEQRRAYLRMWRTRNPDKQRAIVARQDPAKKKAGARRVYHARTARDPGYVAQLRLRSRLRCALRNYAPGVPRRSTKYGIDFAAIFEHIGACPGPREDWHIDHIRPLCSFDLNDPVQVREAFAPQNHRWLPAAENLAKVKADRAQSRRLTARNGSTPS